MAAAPAAEARRVLGNGLLAATAAPGAAAAGDAATGDAMKLFVSGPAKQYHNRPNLGWLLNPRAGASIETIVRSGLPWACDNDCFIRLDRVLYLRMLRRVARQPGLLWVAAPDVVADADATMARFRLWQPVLDYYKLPIAFVAQDGATVGSVPWDEIAALFIGGSTAWKLSQSAALVIRAAAARGKWVHVGRVSTNDRINHFDELPVDSIDTTAASKSPRIMRQILDRLQYQQKGFKHAA